MARKSFEEGIFASLGRAADESLEIAAAIRAGRLTRRQFEDWYAKRRSEGSGLVVTLREKASAMAKPIEEMVAQGDEMLRAPMSPARRLRRPRKNKGK